jgi:pSer/pThr/pTyr-binding forkhead associated (FHA) protein
VLEIAGKRYPISKSRTVIGRGTEADITVDDSGISRKHVEVLWDGTRAQANDLGSTNGSKLNGQRLVSAALEADSVITIGQTSIVLRLLPQASGGASTPAAETVQTPRAAEPGGFWGPRE